MSKITKSARGQECQIRLEGICNFNPETTVFAHLPGGGVGGKVNDIFGSYSCSDCHDAVDGRAGQYGLRCKEEFYEGVFRTQKMLLDKGLIKL